MVIEVVALSKPTLWRPDMTFFALVNLALVCVYIALGSNGPPASAGVLVCGIFLAFLFNNNYEAKRPGNVLLVTLATAIVVLLLFYNSTPIWTSDYLDHLMLSLVIGAVFCAILATVLYGMDRKKVHSVLGWTAFCATALNSLPLISHLLI